MSHQTASSTRYLSPNSKAETHFLLGENSRDNQTFYALSQSKQKPQAQGKFPDLLELSRNTENLINNNSFCTMPRKQSYKINKSRQGSFGSESQSPLLPGSSGDSCDSNFSCSRRPSIDSCMKNTSLPTSPGNFSQTPILNLLEGSPDFYNQSPTTLKYKSWELEKFLKEYRTLQDQLFKMKESCENLKEENLNFREENSEPSATIVQSSKPTQKMLSPTFQASSNVEPFFGVNNKFLENSKKLDSLYGANELIEEDNNNPKSILKNKQSENKPGTGGSGESFWTAKSKIVETGTEPNSGSSLHTS